MDINTYISSGAIEAYVLGLCSDEENQEMESLRSKFPALNNAILAFEISLENNLMKNSSVTAIELDEIILQNFDSLEKPLMSIPVTQTKRYIPLWLKAVAAASFIFFVISSFFNYKLYTKSKEQEKQLQLAALRPAPTLPAADYAVLNDPKITPVAMYGVNLHAICRCSFFWDKKTGKGYMMIHHLPVTASSKNYQLWAMVNGKPVNIGVINEKIRGKFIMMDNIPKEASGFIVTLEKLGAIQTPDIAETYLSGKI